MTCESAEVSLLNGFRDLTLMGVQVRKCCEIRNVRFLILPTDSADSVFHHAHGVITTTNVALPWYRQAFDFNHMNNVLISRDCRKARLIDIDGNSKGSIQPLSWTSNPSFFFLFFCTVCAVCITGCSQGCPSCLSRYPSEYIQGSGEEAPQTWALLVP